MSYSFQIQKASKAEVLLHVRQEFDRVEFSQKSHAVDRAAAEAAAKAFVEMLPDSDSKDIKVMVNGSVSGSGAGLWDGTDFSGLTSAGVQVSALLVDRPAAV